MFGVSVLAEQVWDWGRVCVLCVCVCVLEVLADMLKHGVTICGKKWAMLNNAPKTRTLSGGI